MWSVTSVIYPLTDLMPCVPAIYPLRPGAERVPYELVQSSPPACMEIECLSETNDFVSVQLI